MTTPTTHAQGAMPELPKTDLQKLRRFASGYLHWDGTRFFGDVFQLDAYTQAAIQQAAGAVPEAPHVTLTNAPRSTTGYHDPDRLAAWNAASPSPLGREAGKEGSSDHSFNPANAETCRVQVPLTEAEIMGCRRWHRDGILTAFDKIEFARAIEAAHGIKEAS